MMWWKDAAVKCSLTVMLQDMRLLRQLDSTGHMFHQICYCLQTAQLSSDLLMILVKVEDPETSDSCLIL